MSMHYFLKCLCSKIAILPELSEVNCRVRLSHSKQLPVYTRIQVEKFGTVLPLKIGGSTYMRVTVCQDTCHEFLHKADDVS